MWVLIKKATLVMERLKPFFSYYGSKWNIAPKYPAPKYGKIIEPFCGSAQYSLVYPHLKVELYDIYEPIVMAWDFLIHSSEKDILDLPSYFYSLDDPQWSWISKEAKMLIGFNINQASAGPCRIFSIGKPLNKCLDAQWWGDKKKALIIKQKPYIAHWKIEKKHYEHIPNEQATWFIDPPYQCAAGKRYTHSYIEYDVLEKWVLQRMGQYIVCDMQGVKYGDFKPFLPVRKMGFGSIKRANVEMIWCND